MVKILQKAKCKFCGKLFQKKMIRHEFCCRSCYRRSNNKKDARHPSFLCNNCGTKTELDFFPKQNLEKLKKFI